MANVETLPKYARLAQQIKNDIAQGTLAPGDQLPSFAVLRRDHGATPTTVERVIATLEREGLVERKHGKGVFVRLSPPERTSRPVSALMRRSVAVLNLTLADLERTPSHAPGWADNISVGVADSLRLSSLHALAVNDVTSPESVAADIISLRPAGLIVPEVPDPPAAYFHIVHAVAGAGIPVVAYRGGDDLANIDRVTSDFESGSYQLTKWLIERGRRRLVNLWPDLAGAWWYGPRLAGYRRAMIEANLEPLAPVLTPYIDHAPSAEEMDGSVRTVAGYMAEHITGSQPVDAILAVSDGYVPEIAAMLRLFHRAPNQDVDIAGYDNYWLEMVSPHIPKVLPLATVDKQNHLIGEALVGLLKDRCEGRLGTAPVQRVIPQVLMEVQSG